MGVRRGMATAELDNVEGLCVLRRSAAEEVAARAVVLEVAGGFTPRLEDLTDGPHGTEGACVVVLDGSGTKRLCEPVETMSRRVVRALRELGLASYVAGSGNLLTAVVMARWMASGGRRTVGTVGRGTEAGALAPLPVAMLKLTEAQAETFGAWGVLSLGELAALPEVEVVERLGQGGGRLWRTARGQAEHLLVPEEPGLLEERVEFDRPVDGMEPLMFVLGPMLDQLIARAGNRALDLAVRDRALLLRLLHLDVEAHPSRTGVVRLRVPAQPGARREVQGGLLSPALPEPGAREREARSPGESVAISEKVSEGVTTIQIVSGKAPEEGARRSGVEEGTAGYQLRFTTLRPTVGVTEVGGAEGAAETETRAAEECAAAARRMRPPMPIRWKGREKAAFWMGSVLYEVRARSGPWRRSGSWWTGAVWSQEEWDVTVDGGAGLRLLCVLRHDLLEGRWFLDAIYD